MSFSGTCFESKFGSDRNSTFFQSVFLLYLSLMLMFAVLDDELDVELDDVKSIVLSVVYPTIL